MLFGRFIWISKVGRTSIIEQWGKRAAQVRGENGRYLSGRHLIRMLIRASKLTRCNARGNDMSAETLIGAIASKAELVARFPRLSFPGSLTLYATLGTANARTCTDWRTNTARDGGKEIFHLQGTPETRPRAPRRKKDVKAGFIIPLGVMASLMRPCGGFVFAVYGRVRGLRVWKGFFLEIVALDFEDFLGGFFQGSSQIEMTYLGNNFLFEQIFIWRFRSF